MGGMFFSGLFVAVFFFFWGGGGGLADGNVCLKMDKRVMV